MIEFQEKDSIPIEKIFDRKRRPAPPAALLAESAFFFYGHFGGGAAPQQLDILWEGKNTMSD